MEVRPSFMLRSQPDICLVRDIPAARVHTVVSTEQNSCVVKTVTLLHSTGDGGDRRMVQ